MKVLARLLCILGLTGISYAADIQPVLTARVVRETTFFNRILTVTPVSMGERFPSTFSIRAPRDAEITKNGKSISVHEIRNGDVIFADGSWIDSNFIASRIDVNPDGPAWETFERGRNYRTLQGRIREIHYDDQQFTLVTEDGDHRVYADRARIWKDGDVQGLTALRRSNDVLVRGNVDGKSVDAERIEVVPSRRL